jgi:tetratricopeptide (TPR) repeat protein
MLEMGAQCIGSEPFTAAAAFAEAAGLLEQQGQEPERLEALIGTGAARAGSGDLEGAAQAYAEAVAVAADLPDARRLVQAHWGCADVCAALQRWDEVLEHACAAVEAGQQYGVTGFRAASLALLGQAQQACGAHGDALATLQAASRCFADDQDVAGVVRTDMLVIDLLLAIGSDEEALDLAQTTVRVAGVLPSDQRPSRALALLARAQEATGRDDAALETLAQARRESMAGARPLQVAWCDDVAGRILLRQGRLDPAREVLKDAESVLSTMGGRTGWRSVAASLVRLEDRAGQPQEAVRWGMALLRDALGDARPFRTTGHVSALVELVADLSDLPDAECARAAAQVLDLCSAALGEALLDADLAVSHRFDLRAVRARLKSILENPLGFGEAVELLEDPGIDGRTVTQAWVFEISGLGTVHADLGFARAARALALGWRTGESLAMDDLAEAVLRLG